MTLEREKQIQAALLEAGRRISDSLESSTHHAS
jgi:hypothetical protein